MVICQRSYGYNGRPFPWLSGLVLLSSLTAVGCAYLNDAGRLKTNGGVPAGPPPLTAEQSGAGGLAGKATGWGLALVGIGWVGRRYLRLRREAPLAQTLDREDLALIRTAREALTFLLRKRWERLGVAMLFGHGRRRGGPAP